MAISRTVVTDGTFEKGADRPAEPGRKQTVCCPGSEVKTDIRAACDRRGHKVWTVTPSRLMLAEEGPQSGETSIRCILVSLGTLGDVHPFVALALELRNQGHTPVLAASEPCRPIALRHQIEFHPIRPDGAQVMADKPLGAASHSA